MRNALRIEARSFLWQHVRCCWWDFGDGVGGRYDLGGAVSERIHGQPETDQPETDNSSVAFRGLVIHVLVQSEPKRLTSRNLLAVQSRRKLVGRWTESSNRRKTSVMPQCSRKFSNTTTDFFYV
jgi:hypothetical protein